MKMTNFLHYIGLRMELTFRSILLMVVLGGSGPTTKKHGRPELSSILWPWDKAKVALPKRNKSDQNISAPYANQTHHRECTQEPEERLTPG